MFRKYMGFFLMGIFISQLIGFTVYFNIEKAQVKKQLKTFLKEGVPVNQFKSFNFSKKEFENLVFTKPGKEFVISGRFYDIVHRKNEEGKMLLECVDDIQESKLFKNLAFLVNKNLGKENSSSPLKIAFSIIQIPILLNNFSLKVESSSWKSIKKEKFLYLEKNSDFFPSMIFPPPKYSLYI